MVNCEPAWWIGHRSSGSHGGSPNGTSQRVGLDVEAEKVIEKAQTGRERVTEWTSKHRKSQKKSKQNENEHITTKKEMSQPVTSP